jgi:hypothetical protein
MNLPRYLSKLSHYVSTYCLHDDHAACRMTCKTCGQRCRCECHLKKEVYVGAPVQV